MSEARPRVITAIGVLMIAFGATEVVTAFRHEFLGLRASVTNLFTYSAAAIGICYAAAGALTLTMKKWALTVVIVLLTADVLGRIALVATGLYPVNSVEQVVGIFLGTAVAAAFAIYLVLERRLFR